MTGDGSAGWSDVEPEQFSSIEGDEFERFCAVLIDFEANDRHIDHDLDGGAGKYRADGGRDVLLTVSKPPRITRNAYRPKYSLAPVTEDPLDPPTPTRTAYSCKSGKTWLTKALGDAREGGERAFEVLAEGGYFKLLINQRELLDAEVKRDHQTCTPHEHLRRAYWDRLRASDPDADDPRSRIQILDASWLARYLHARQPSGPVMDRWAARLQLTPLLPNLDDWRRHHESDRRGPTGWVQDEARACIGAELRAWLARTPARGDSRVAYLVGKPGVGKTRLVIEALSADPALAQRVQVARSADEADRMIDANRLLRRHPDVVLIVDDCLVREAREIAHLFDYAAPPGSRAHAVLLVPASPESVRSELARGQDWSLAPLGDAHARELIASSTGLRTSDPQVVALARLCEGFPWFARLLADEFVETDSVPADMGEATRAALASRREVGSLAALQLRRAKCLLAVSLTSNVDWDRLGDDARARLARAVGLPDWPVLMEMALGCDARGILRRRIGWQFKYVTPQVLEREIIAWLLGPDGPDPGGRELARHGDAYLESFADTLERLGLPASTISGIVDVALTDLCASELPGLATAGLLGARLRLLAQHRPAETARELRRMIDATELERLRADHHGRRGLVWALELLSLRRPALEDAEAALFRLAWAENEGYANNATQTWAALASPAGVAARVDVLARRLQHEDPLARRVALRGVEVALSRSSFRRAHDEPGPTPTQLRPHVGIRDRPLRRRGGAVRGAATRRAGQLGHLEGPGAARALPRRHGPRWP